MLTLGAVRIVGWTLAPAERPPVVSEMPAGSVSQPDATAGADVAEAPDTDASGADADVAMTVEPPVAAPSETDTADDGAASAVPSDDRAAGAPAAVPTTEQALDAPASQPPAFGDVSRQLPANQFSAPPAEGLTAEGLASGPDAEATPPAGATAEAGPAIAAGVAAPLPPEGIGSMALREAAAKGDPRAQFEVAARFVEGRGTTQDLKAAAEWYGRAADSGLAVAQYRLGSLYENGSGLPRDFRAASDWYTRAAEAGNAKAMHNLAVLMTDGSLGNPDYAAAAGWFVKAAELGIRDSQYNLGILYARGFGVPPDLASSYKWFALAANAGDTEAVKKRDDVARSLSEDALARARLAVETWTARPLDPASNEVEIDDPAWLEMPKPTVASVPSGDLVQQAQALLARQGFDPGPADGMMGKRTRDAIIAFQRQRGLTPTGEVDAALVQALGERSI
ncbi:Localization factor PodJL [Methylobrevis pamukkalensis]|uniref:Localization factor PodJL n=1 Tax=Methylobrevis pamukkalensis TaxID=1439726 RepID=A0A1E3GYI0_9HYPH|nr:Localization factor PodJL [Methylobrevis pamukkalensis]